LTDQSIRHPGNPEETVIDAQATDRTLEGRHLRRALELAEAGRGRVSPNPMVGAVIADPRGEVIGEGHHAELGGPHAERAAIADCQGRGAALEGATMYVTLEPCAHQGRQPPCTEAILEAGISRVVIASEDPTEKAAGRGPGILRDGGVEVELAQGAVAADARLLNQPFRKHARSGRPLVILKTAISLDGRVASASGEPIWITGPASRALVHRWRAEADAVAVGIGTALADDPLLTAREVTAFRQPARVVFDSNARLPLDSKLVRSVTEAPLLVIASAEAERSRLDGLRGAGVEVLVASGRDSAERLLAALDDLGRRGVTSLFLEGGPRLAAAFAAAGEIDETRLFVAPVLLGDARLAPQTEGRIEAAGGEGSLLEEVGEDVLIRARLREW
jgi:diaminohydroxyphosphoribosylaminopyrimidine deaminase / 5-amino-6-(5-phosphoribosylamino)uracil reductase